MRSKTRDYETLERGRASHQNTGYDYSDSGSPSRTRGERSVNDYDYERGYDEFRGRGPESYYRRAGESYGRSYGYENPETRASYEGAQGYGGYDRGYNYGNDYYTRDRDYDVRFRRDDDRNFFERAGERIRDKWNDWTHPQSRHRRDYHSEYGRGDDRNFFERAGERIRDAWNDWRDDHNRRRDHGNDYGREREFRGGNYDRGRYYEDDYNRGNYGNQGYGRGDNWNTGNYGQRSRSRGQYGTYNEGDPTW